MRRKAKTLQPVPRKAAGHSRNRFPVKLGQDELAGTGTEVRHSEGFEI